jgi:hypothetical protein
VKREKRMGIREVGLPSVFKDLPQGKTRHLLLLQEGSGHTEIGIFTSLLILVIHKFVFIVENLKAVLRKARVKQERDNCGNVRGKIRLKDRR